MLYRILTLLLVLYTLPLQAKVDVYKYVQALQNQDLNLSSSSNLLNIIDSCGNSPNLNDDCVVKSLQQAAEGGDEAAKQLANSYIQALGEGNYFNAPECQTPSHQQANSILAHCILLMNYNALKTQDKEGAIKQYEMCVQGGMQGLVYQGNIVAQYILADMYQQKGLSQPAEVWKRGLQLRENTPEFQTLMKCYN